MPPRAGTYNLRFFSKDSFVRLATSVPVTVVSPTLTITPSAASGGATVTVVVANAPGFATDWIGLYSVDASDGSYLDWKFLNGTRVAPSTGVSTATLTFTMPATPGRYNLRLFANNSFINLANSITIITN